MIQALLLFIGIALWYVVYGVECALNGASFDRSLWRQVTMPFECLWNDFWRALPFIGPRLKANHIRTMVDNFGQGVICTSGGSFDYSEIRDKNLYRKVGKLALPGRLHFALMHVALPFAPLAGGKMFFVVSGIVLAIWFVLRIGVGIVQFARSIRPCAGGDDMANPYRSPGE